MQKSKFEVGQSVFVVMKDKLQEKTVTGMLTTISKINTKTYYHYWFEELSNFTGALYSHQFIDEEKVFATKEEYIASL